MAIKGLKQDARSLPRAGIIRLGYKTRYCLNDKCKYKLAYKEPDTTTCPKCAGDMGKQTTAELPHFALHDAPGVAAALGTDCPTELKVYFPFDEIEKNFPSARTLFYSSYMACQGDGQTITYAVNSTTGQTVVKDGVCILPFSERLADGKTVATHKPGDKMPCPAVNEPDIYAKCAGCNNSGILLVLLDAVPTTAYFQISTHSTHNLENLPGEMLYVQEIIENLTGRRRLTGVPFILRRVLRSKTYVKTDKQGKPIGRGRTEKYVLQLEIEPEFMLDMVRAQRRLANPMTQFALPATVPSPAVPRVDIVDTPPIGFAEPPQWEPADIEEGDFEEVKAAPEPAESPAAPAPVKAEGRPALSPAELKEALAKKIERSTLRDKETKEYLPVNLHSFGDKTANLVAVKFEEAFAGQVKPKECYHAALRWLLGVESANDLAAAQADALLDWLLNGNKAQKWGASITSPAPQEALLVYQEAVKAERAAQPADGQIEMSLEGQPASELDPYFPR